jgi:hypothetical protein
MNPGSPDDNVFHGLHPTELTEKPGGVKVQKNTNYLIPQTADRTGDISKTVAYGLSSLVDMSLSKASLL